MFECRGAGPLSAPDNNGIPASLQAMARSGLCFAFFVVYKQMKPPAGGTSLDYKDNNSKLTFATTDWDRAFFL
ncbi:MAG: hypothetical protein ACJAWL_001215 [Motiliproteus sp.]|jgi:hypothetical protein